MATGTRLMQEISDQFLNCKICFENFRDPKTLSCLHTFCCHCLQNQYEQEISSRTTRYTISIYNRQVTCPLCRKKTDLPTGGVKRLPDNFLVSNLTEVLAKRTVSKVPPCEICTSVRAKNVDACSKCLDCSKLLCRACVDLHLSTKVTQQHSLIDLEGEKDIQCKSHPDEYVRFYCDPCDACICVVCAFQEHKDHEVCSFSDGSAKYRSSFEVLLGKCKERLSDVSTRLNVIEKYETTMKDVKERIRDLAISYISQVRAKEKELMMKIEEEYGGEIKDFVDQKQILQKNLDELQSTCNLTDIMLKDKGVELLLIKKDVEGRMTQLLQPVLPDVPSQPTYDLRFVPGDVALGRLAFGGDDKKDINDVNEEIIYQKKVKRLEFGVGSGSLTQSNDPDVVTDIDKADKCKTKEMFTSMSSDMSTAFSHSNSQTEAKSVMSRDTFTVQTETRERGVFAKVSDVRVKGTMTERTDVRSLKCQTEQIQPNDDLLQRSAENTNHLQQQQRVSQTSSTTATKFEQAISTKRNESVGEALVSQAEIRTETAAEMLPATSKGDYRPAPDLLPTSVGLSAYSYTPGRRIRSIRIQTEISTLDVESAAASSDKEFASLIVQSQLAAEKLKKESDAATPYSRFRDRPRRVRTTETGVLTVSAVELTPAMAGSQTSTQSLQKHDTDVHSTREISNTETRTRIIKGSTSCTMTKCDTQHEKATSTLSTCMTDKETSTPVTTLQNKVTWTEVLPTSDRATATIPVKTLDHSTGTMPVKTGDIGVQIKPYSNGISTNTPTVSLLDQEAQTAVQTVDQGTVPDKDIEMFYAKKEKELAKAAEVLESSVDYSTPPQSPVKVKVQTVDKATDPVKTPSFSKSTETMKIKTVTSSTETQNIKYVDKDTATVDTKTIDQWTETIKPQLINTGVTPPIPATISVGVVTNVVLTDEQATCTDMKAYRDSHTETILVVCDNETLTDTVKHADAQTSVEIYTDSQECATDQLENTDEGSMTECFSRGELTNADSHATQCEGPVLRTRETNTTRKRRKAKEVQTEFAPVPCVSCGHTSSDAGLKDIVQITDNESNADVRLSGDQRQMAGKEFKDSSTMPFPSETQDVGTMAISCVTCQHDFQETAIQTSHPKLYDKSSATSFELDLDFLERALSRDYQDAATSTESLPYIGLLSEIDVDELIVVPEAAFELVSDTDSEYDLVMVDDETSTDFQQSVEAGTQTYSLAEDGVADESNSLTESTGNRGVGEIIRSMVESQGMRKENVTDRHLVSIGVNTIPKVTFEKETCTPIRHLFSKGTMTFFVAKMDKSTSTFNQARIVTGSSLPKTKSEDKITMTAKPEKKDIGIETEATAMDGRITQCISKLRSVSEKLNSPPAKKATDRDAFFGAQFASAKTDVTDKSSSAISSMGSPPTADKPEEERQRQLKMLLEQTNAVLKSKDPSPVRKPQPITTLKGRKPAEPGSLNPNINLNITCPSSTTLKPEEVIFDSKSLPRGFPSERPGTVRMGSQPLSPSRLPLLRYNSAPGRIATVPTQTLLKLSGQSAPMLSPSSPRLSPSKIPISRKLSPPENQVRSQPQQQQQIVELTSAQETVQPLSPLRRPLPSITETRTPSSCSDSSTASYISAESNASVDLSSKRLSLDSAAPAAVCNRLSTDSEVPVSASSQTTSDSVSTSASNRLSLDLTVPQSRPPSTTTSSLVTSMSLSDSVFRKSSSDVSHSAESNETVEEKPQSDDKAASAPPKKSGMGFMQRLLSRKKKVPEGKKEQVPVLKAGPPTAAAVAALASASPPLPAPPPESYAITPLHLPPHHYPPLPEHISPTLPRKPRPFVYVQQRIVSIQQDNVEEMEEKKTKHEDSKPEDSNEDAASVKEKKKVKDKAPEKQKDKSKKDIQAEKDKKKKEEKEKTKVKVAKTKSKKTDDATGSPMPGKKLTGSVESKDK